MKITKIEAARRLGISNTALNRIAYKAQLQYQDIMLNGKLTRHYEWEDVLKAIKEGKYSRL